MDIGATKIMEGPRQVFQESSTQSAGGSTSTLTSTCSSNLPLDNARSVALETAPNPLSYWPPPSSALPLINSSKDTAEDPQNQVTDPDHPCPPDSAKKGDRNPSRNASPGESPAGNDCGEVSRSSCETSTSVTSQATRILHHNLPPIAGITSSHNYRGAREVHKHSHSHSIDAASKSATEEVVVNGSENKKSSVESKETIESKTVTETEKVKTDQSGDCEIVEVPPSTSAERPKTANSSYVFPVPTPINSTSHSKTILTLRAPTPFVHVSAPGQSPATSSVSEALTLNVNACSNPSAGSPSPSGRTASSPQFIAPSPTAVPMSKCSSPSEPVRLLPSPHSNLSSPSSMHRLHSSSHVKMSSNGDSSRMQQPSARPVGHPPTNPPSPSQRIGSLPYVSNSHSNFPYLNTPRNNLSNSPVSNFHPESNRPRSAHDSMDGDRVFKDSHRQNHTSQIPRLGLPNLSTLNSSHSNSPQRIDQSLDTQTCRNPFELPVPKPYSQHYQPQPKSFNHYPNNVRQPSDVHPKPDHYVNLPKEHQRPSGSGFFPSGLKPMPAKVSDDKEPERQCDPQYRQMLNLQPSQNDGSVQRRLGNPLRNDEPQRDYMKQSESVGSKPNSVSAVGGSAWNKPETSEIGNKNAYLNTQNLKQSFNKVNGNEYPNRRIPETGYQNIPKPADGFGGRFSVSNGDKQNFNLVNQSNSLSQRFPPVPQSNYDLNRQIYDSMTGGGRVGQPPMSRPMEKTSPQFPSSREQNIVNTESSKNQPYYRDFPEHDKGKGYMQSIPVKPGAYPDPPRIPTRPSQDYRTNSYGQYNSMNEKTAHDTFQNKRPPVSQPAVSSGFLSNETRQPQQGGPAADCHRALGQGLVSGINSSHQISQTTSSAAPIDRNRLVHTAPSPSMFSQKHQGLVEYESKKMMEAKRGATSQFPNPQNVQPSVQPLIPSVQAKGRPPSCATAPIRSKRESPLDLSVKTVRQSADSTAKDDGEVYLQSFRNFVHNSSQPPQLESRYPVTQSNDGATGAPKIDFTPNFSSFHTDTHHSPTPQHHKSDISVLPPVDSFKKFPARLPTPVVQDVKSKSSFSAPKYFSPAISNQKPQSSSTDQTPARYPQMGHFKSEAQKRPLNDPGMTHPSQSKIPKIDPWKLAFDQQIEQRLNSARISHENSQNAERALNGIDVPKSASVSSHYPSNYQTSRHSSNHYRGANMYPQPPVQTSATPYNPSFMQQPQCQSATPQTPQEKIQHRENVGHSPDPEQIIKQISKGVMPDHKLLQDKNVLSILRSSLEEKEAKLMQLREAARRKEKYKEFVTSDLGKKPFQPYEQISKTVTHTKQSLPPFGALTLERMCAPPSFPGHRLNLPRPVDTVKIDVEPTQKYFSPTVKNEAEKSGIPNVDLSPQDDAQGPPTDLDGLAAFLAARIRTKGELKQVGPTLEPGRPTLNQHFKDHSAAPVTSLSEALDRDHPSNHSLQSSNFSLSGSPPKLVRESSRLLPPLRRRLFSHTEEETPTTSAGQSNEQPPIPPRDPNGIRSSSETSVFDFRESDSEGEMPVLERQTLEGMRRDRKTFGSKQNVSTTTPDDVMMDVDKPEVIAELDKSHPDPFWDTAFDMFVEQLEKRPPKRSVRKKKVCSRNPFTGSEAEEDDKVRVGDAIEKVKASSESADDQTLKPKVEELDDSCKFEVKKEPEERDKVENVQDGHVKLSSSRLKVYRDEMMKEAKIEKEKDDKLNASIENVPKEAEKESEKQKTKEVISQAKKDGDKGKKDESRITTRGKSKVGKGTVFPDYESDTEGRNQTDLESTQEEDEEDDDDDSLSLSGLESESSDSESSPESSNSNFSSYDDSENETVAKKKMRMQTRLQTRSSRQRQVKGTGMKLRSKPVPLPKATSKPTKKKKKKKEEYYSCGKKKKPSFGDGSGFRPGWEEECYKFKQQLRMPEKLISISRPPKRPSASLPDLDPYRNSPSLDSSDVSMTKKSDCGKAAGESDESDADLSKPKSKSQEASFLGSDNAVTTLLKLRNGKKSQSSSILNMLVNKYGKEHLKKKKELKSMNERKSPRILPKATNKPELLPTPSLGIGKENVLKDKKRSKELGKKKPEEGDSMYLGYFRRKTVNNFKEAFKQKVGLLPQEFSPVILKSRTRTQTRDLKKRATLVEVFGEERPASAPPLTREEDTSTDQEKVEKSTKKKKPKIVKKVCGGVVTRGRGKLTRSGRPGLRSTAVLRSNKAVQISKRHLNSGRKRNMELLRIRAMTSKKFSYLVTSSDAANQLPITKKRLKLRSVRRKFRSGFDYIRKKKKMKKDGDSIDGSVKEKRLSTRPTSESVEDIQNEIKNWVINKGLGETILHRAARLGYTDVAAYCLEKMDCSPSPRDNAGYTPLHEACSRGHLEIAKLLLMYGASVSESAKGGIRPLHEAAENGFTELIRLLLSYGADPLLETYTGHTALSLVTDEEARRLIQHHLADVQGNVAPVWTFQGPSTCFDPPESGYDPLCDPPSPHSVHTDVELEISETILPPLYRLTGDREQPERRWVLMRDLLSFTKAKSKEVLVKQLGSSSASFREMKLTDFHEQGRCCNLLGIGDKAPTKASKVVLIPYDDNVRQLLNIEKVVV